MTRDEIWEMCDHKLDSALSKATGSTGGFLPNYSRNLHALRFIEATLTPEQWAEYLGNLVQILADMPADQRGAIAKRYPSVPAALLRGAWYGMTATPRQRAEALLMVLTEEDQ
jgi:hypothetical protein